MNYSDLPHMEQHTDKQHILNLRVGPSHAISAKEAERSNSDKSQTYPVTNTNPKPGVTQYHSLGPTPQYLGTNHLEPLQQQLQQLIPVLDQFLDHAKLEAAHVPHLGSVMRNARSLSRRTIRLARLVGRLYGSQGWELKYSHATNTALERKLKARGGYDALRVAQMERDNAQ